MSRPAVELSPLPSATSGWGGIPAGSFRSSKGREEEKQGGAGPAGAENWDRGSEGVRGSSKSGYPGEDCRGRRFEDLETDDDSLMEAEKRTDRDSRPPPVLSPNASGGPDTGIQRYQQSNENGQPRPAPMDCSSSNSDDLQMSSGRLLPCASTILNGDSAHPQRSPTARATRTSAAKRQRASPYNEGRSLAGYTKDRPRDARTPAPLRKAQRESEQHPEAEAGPPPPLHGTTAASVGKFGEPASSASSATASRKARRIGTSGGEKKVSSESSGSISSAEEAAAESAVTQCDTGSSASSFRSVESRTEEESLLMVITPPRPMPRNYGERKRWYCHVGACLRVAQTSGKCEKHHRMWSEQHHCQQQQKKQREEGATQSQSSATATDCQNKPQGTRVGAWTAGEEEYAAAIIRHFRTGSLPTALPKDTTLCAFIAEKLVCDPNRVYRKFKDFRWGSIKAARHSSKPGCPAWVERDKVERELRELEARFRAGLDSASGQALVDSETAPLVSSVGVSPRPPRVKSRGQQQRRQKQGKEGARPQGSATATDSEQDNEPEALREGAWTKGEEEYAAAIIRHFRTGSLPTPLQKDTCLCTFIAEKLACSTKRVRNKFRDIRWGSIKAVRHIPSSRVERDKVETELRELEATFTAGLSSVDSETAPFASCGVSPRPPRASGRGQQHHQHQQQQEGTKGQSPATATDSEQSRPDGRRTGTWTAGEEEYAAAIIYHFSAGSLPTPLPKGSSLCAFLGEKLACDPKRVRNKFPEMSWARMKPAGHRSLSVVERDKVKSELQELEARFKAGMASASGLASGTASSSWGETSRPPQKVGSDAADIAESDEETEGRDQLLQAEASDQAVAKKAPLRREASVEQRVEREEKTEAAAPFACAGGAGGGTLSIGEEIELPNKRWRKLDDHFPADFDGEGEEEAVGATSRGVVVTVCSKKVRLLPLYAVGAEYMRGGKPSSGDAAAVRGFLKAYLEAYDAFEEPSETLPREWAALARRVVVVKRKKKEGRRALEAIRPVTGASYQ